MLEVTWTSLNLAILPPLLLFALLNRYYVRGLFAGAVKG